MINILAIIPTPSTSSKTEETIYTDIIYPTDDSWIELTQPHCNHGTEREIHIKTSCDTISRAYLKFNLTIIPTDKEIISAKLYLYCVDTDPKGDILVNIHKTEDNWNEHTITWNNAPPVGTPVASTTIVDKKNKFYSWDITPYAQTEHKNDKTLSIVAKFPMDDPVCQDSNPQYETLFGSKETPPKHKRPYLEIVYTSAKPPIANFTYSPNNPVTYETVTFNASTSYDPNGHITTYTWNFGDQNTTTTTNPTITHVYTDPGNFTTTLTVTDNDGFTNSTTAMVTVSNPTILRVSLPNGTIAGPNPDPWLNEGWLLNLTEPSLTFHVRVNTTSHTHPSYDTHLIIALDDITYNNLINLTIDSITILKTAFQYGTPKPYNIWTWPNDVYPTWFNDTHVNLGAIPPKGHKEIIFSAIFSGLATVRIHLDAYGKVILNTPIRASHITWSPNSEDSTVLFQPRPPPLSVSISPTSVVMDVSQSVTFDSSVSSGTPPYTYQWYLDDAPVSSATASTWAFFPTSPGTYKAHLNVTDTVGVTAQSNRVSITVNPALTVSISPTTVVMNLDQSATFQSTVSGGTQPYTYQWHLNDIAIPGATSNDWTFTPTSTGFYTICVNVTDSVNVTTKSNVASITVSPELSVSINPISATMNLGDSKTFTSSVSGGAPPYTYQWHLNDTPVLYATFDSWTFTPTATGSYIVYLNVTDSVDVTTKSNIASITINPPLEVSIIPTSVVMNVGQSQTFTSSVSGGTPSYTYQWYLDGTLVGADPNWAFTPTSPSSYEVYLNVTDNVGVTAKSNTASVTVNPALSVSIFPMSVTIDASESQLFTSTISGGTSPYTYQWYLNGTAVPDAIHSSWTFTPTTMDYYLVHLRVTDDVNISVESDTASVIVRRCPKAAFTYSPLYPYVNETVTFNASASTPNGGVISNYTWFFGDDKFTIVTDPVTTHAYAAGGSYTVTLVVTDSEGLLDNTSETITVYSPELHSSDYKAHHLGEEFLIDVVIVNATHLSSFEFKLGYNTTLLDAINITEGPFLKSFGSTSTTMEIHDPESYVLINIALLASILPDEGSGILATIKFRVTYATVYPETVVCNLDLYDTELNDPTGQPIPHTVVNGLYELVPLPPQPPCIGPAIDIYTQKLDPYGGKGPNMPSNAFGPQEEVILYAYVSYNCEPVQNKLVVFEVKNPSDEPVIFRTATSNAEGIATSSFRIPWEAEEAESVFGEWTIYGSVEICETKVNDTCTFKFGWIIEITQVKTADTYGSLKSSFTKGEHINFNITVKNIAFTSKIASFTLAVYDECDVPIGHVVLHDWLISPGTTEIFIIGLQIPKWAYVGIGTVYANAYTDLPQLYVTPYCPEISTTFTITKP